MLETTTTILASVLLGVVLAGGLFTVLVGFGSAVARSESNGHSRRITLHH